MASTISLKKDDVRIAGVFKVVTESTVSPPVEPTTPLAPSYAIPIVLVLGAIPLLLVQPIASAAIALFGIFLLFQAVTLRLVFTPTDLDIYRGEKVIRRFPYTDWLNWRIFWQPVPILFYFKEVRSIHFLPILFNPKGLKAALEQHNLPKI